MIQEHPSDESVSSSGQPPEQTHTKNGPSRLRIELGLIKALWFRDLIRIARERSRWLGVVLQPLLFWVVIGSGMADTFKPEGLKSDYLHFFFPGILVMIVLFTTIFASMAIIEDRQQGFLQQVLVAPGSRLSLVLGKVAGVTTVALIQLLLCMAVAPLAGYPLFEINPFIVLGIAIIGSVGLTGLSFTMAWLINSTHGYHAVMAVILLPLWMVSGSMFVSPGGWMEVVMTFNPMTYIVDGLRHGLSEQNEGAIFTSIETCFAALSCFAFAMLLLSTVVIDRVRKDQR
jgi:ABC-2 type transport system permease protein